jgi:hypothetical protein
VKILKEKIKIERIGLRSNSKIFEPLKETDLISFKYGDTKFTITPDFDGKVRINKINDYGDSISINPGCANEILLG